MTAKPRVFLTRRWPAAVEAVLAERYDAVLNPEDRPLDSEALRAGIADCDAFCPTVTDPITEEVIEAAGNRCRLIGNFGVGYNHIDTAAAAAKGMIVTNTPGVLTDATADIALTLLLMTLRRAGEGERELRSGQWSGWRPTHLLGAQVGGRTLGLVGFGRIAQATAKRARAFGMEIAYYSRNRAEAAIEEEFGATYHGTLRELAAASDVLSLHVPGGVETRNMIDGDVLAALKPGSFVINTARGDVLDEAALVAALESGHLAGAGLDVYQGEPRVNPGLLRDDVVLLPHLGSATATTREAMGNCVVRNLDAYFAGREPPDRVA